MVLSENIFGLFDYYEYSFPNEVFYSKIDNGKEVQILSCIVVILGETIFQYNDELNSFFMDILNHPKYKENEFPFVVGKKIIKKRFFLIFLKEKRKESFKDNIKIS